MRLGGLFSLVILVLSTNTFLFGQTCDREHIIIKNEVFKVSYSELLEQPLWVIYRSTNRPKNVDRGSMNFHKEVGICTSDNDDYKSNIWDKGHMAPAATFSDSEENLYTTFSYLNCSLQDKYLNRGEWRLLESQERVWDDSENLTIMIIPVYSKQSKLLPSRGTVPDAYHKHIKFESKGNIVCYFFPNEKPSNGWENHLNTKNCTLLKDFSF